MRLRLVAAALLLAGAAAGTAVLLRDPSSPASAVRIAYTVEDLATGARTTEVLEIDRPRVSRRLLDDGGSMTTQDGVYDRAADGQWRRLAVVPPGEVGQDLQLAAPLAWAETAGRATRDGTGSVAGRACTWWLTREPLDVAPFAPATAQDRARSCVDDRGLLLADTWRAGGRDLRSRTATAVTSVASLAAFDGATPEPIDARLVTTVVQQLSEPAGDLVIPRPPPRADLLAAVRMVEVAPGTTDVVRRTQRAVYRTGDVVVVLDQVDETAGPPVPQGDGEVDLGALGTGRVRATGGGLVVEVRVGDGLLRVRSGLPLASLVAWMATLDPR